MKGHLIKLMIGVLIVVCFAFTLNAQHKRPENVAFFLFDGVELFDFTGPHQVFSDAGLNTYTVSADGKEILSNDSVKVFPKFSMGTAPAPDMIVFPGGSGGAPLNAVKDPKVMDWLKQKKEEGVSVMSVGEAAAVFAEAGFLDNKRATTCWRTINDMSKTYPAVTMIKDTRWVDNGHVITTAGVSAGIDGALHVVSKFKGLDAARAVALDMEYDKWIPDDGVVDEENDVIKKLRTASMFNYMDSKKFANGILQNDELVYEGELLNLATELNTISAYKRSAFVLEVGTDLFPDSDPMYSMLTAAYKRIGKSAPMEGASLMKLISERRIEEAIMAFEKSTKEFPGWTIAREREFSAVIEVIALTERDYTYAAKVCELALKAYPASAHMHFWMGRVYKYSGMKDQALASLKESVKFDAAYSDRVSKEIDELEGPQKNE